MGLFGRGSDEGFAATDPNISFDISKSVLFGDSDQQEQQTVTQYGIQKAIELVRELPDIKTNTESVVRAVVKTMESADIQVSEIILEAEEREESAKHKRTKLQSKLDELNTQVLELNKEIIEINTDIEETMDVRNYLLAYIEIYHPVTGNAENNLTVTNSNIAEIEVEEKNEATSPIRKEAKKTKNKKDTKEIITADNIGLLDDSPHRGKDADELLN